MNATIRFNLHNPDDRKAHFRVIKSIDMAILLHKINELCYRYESIPTDEVKALFDEYNVNINEILD